MDPHTTYRSLALNVCADSLRSSSLEIRKYRFPTVSNRWVSGHVSPKPTLVYMGWPPLHLGPLKMLF